jgi:hypothetical protein
MKTSVVELREESVYTLNAISLKKAVLCADCDVISDSPHDRCLVCGSRSLFNVCRLFGGMLPKQRATLIDNAAFSGTPPQPVLAFSRSHRVVTRADRGRIKSKGA